MWQANCLIPRSIEYFFWPTQLGGYSTIAKSTWPSLLSRGSCSASQFDLFFGMQIILLWHHRKDKTFGEWNSQVIFYQLHQKPFFSIASRSINWLWGEIEEKKKIMKQISSGWFFRPLSIESWQTYRFGGFGLLYDLHVASQLFDTTLDWTFLYSTNTTGFKSLEKWIAGAFGRKVRTICPRA